MPTYAEALLDRTVPFHWFLELRVGETVIGRFASSDLSIGDTRWSGLLTMQRRPQQSVDPLSGRGSVCSCTCVLAPQDAAMWSDKTYAGARPYDIEAIHAVPYYQMRALVWRHPQADVWNGTDGLLIDGYVGAAEIGADGAFSLEVTDSTLRYDRRIPRHRLTTTRFPDMHNDERGEGPNVLYNQFRAIPCPVIDTVNNYGHAAWGEIASITQAYLDDDAIATESLTTGLTDPRGDEYSRVNIGQAHADKQLTIDGTGLKDNRHGMYTGTPNALIVNPADQMAHFAVKHCEIPREKIDWDAFRALRVKLSGWQTDLKVLGHERTTVFRVLQEMAKLFIGAVYEERGRITVKTYDATKRPALNLVEGDNLLAWGPVRCGDDDIPAEVRLKCDYGWVGKLKERRIDYRDELVKDGDDVDAFRRARLRGADSHEIETMFLSHNNTETKVLLRQVEFLQFVHKEAAALADRSSHELRILDKVAVTAEIFPHNAGEGCTGKEWMVTEIAYDLETNELGLHEVRLQEVETGYGGK